MSLEVVERQREGIRILDLKGRITVGNEASILRETVQGFSSMPAPNAVFNMEGIDYIDSTGLGALVTCYSTLKKAGGAAKLLNLIRRNIELLIMTKLATVFEIFTDEQDAVNSFFPDRKINRFDILSFVQQQPE